MDGLVELLFKYRPILFEKGTLAFGAPWGARLFAVVALIGGAAALWAYTRSRGSLRPRDRAILSGLRGLALATLVFCLLRPVLVLSTAVPQRNVVGVVIDDSRSMRIVDEEGGARGDFAMRAFGGPDSALFKSLAERFQLRFFRASGEGGRASELGTPSYGASRTRLGPALLRAHEELAGAPVAGFILVSDGADNAKTIPGEAGLTEQLLSLKARRVPVFTIGVGSERFAKDIEIARVEAPRTVLRDASLLVDAIIMQRGYGGEKVTVVVEDSGRIVGTKEVTLPRDGEAVAVRVRVPTTEVGARILTVRVPTRPDEQVMENNVSRTLLTVRDRREKILYIEGEPRFELKFIRRAVEQDRNIQLVTLLRSAQDKFLRLSVDDSLELAAGFPRTREELFKYRGIVLGSIEASFFTIDQLRMLNDFVSERGGGLMMLGGRLSFAEGGYAGTPLADALPMELGPAPPGRDTAVTELAVAVPAAGLLHPATQIAGSDSASATRWRALPHVTTVNQLGRTKPGATVLLTGSMEGERSPRAVLAFQRFGRGKAIAMPIQDSWLWQMHADVAVEDLSHETFWRQVLRWLVSDVPDRVEVLGATDDAAPGEAVGIRAQVADAAYLRANGATVRAQVTAPDGRLSEVPLEWSVERDGEYRGTIIPDSSGVYTMRVTATLGADTVRAEEAFVRAAESTAEFFGAERRTGLLERVASETGGKYYDAASSADLARDITYSQAGVTVVERKDLWDMPIIFLILLACIAGEWMLRRRRGMA